MVFPTEIEGLPLSVIEGQMMGLPVLGQPRTAMPELVTNGKNGYLIEGTDTEQWVAKLQEVIDRPDNAPHSAWRQEIRAQAVQKCSWSVVAQKYRELYASLMKS